MDERIEKLKNIQTGLLIDVVKNHKKHGYPLELREAAIEILKGRGITSEELKLSGNLYNLQYEEAMTEYRKFNINSTLGFILYILAVLTAFGRSGISIIIYLAAMLFIGLAFNNSKRIAQITKDDLPDYYIVLLPSFFFYFIMFFITRKQVKERIDLMT